jgi:hypothetical protein
MLWAVRAAWAFSGLLWFFWLGYEDRSLTSVMLIAVAIIIAVSMTIFFRTIWSREAPGSRGFFWTSLLGLAAGLSVGPTTVLLVAVKISLHDHTVPDFTAQDMVSVLNRMPIWGIIGLLSGMALGWVFAIRKR